MTHTDAPVLAGISGVAVVIARRVLAYRNRQSLSIQHVPAATVVTAIGPAVLYLFGDQVEHGWMPRGPPATPTRRYAHYP